MSFADQPVPPDPPTDKPSPAAPAPPFSAPPAAPLAPPWSLGRSLLIFGLLFAAILLCQSAAMLVAQLWPAMRRMTIAELGADPFVVIGGMTAAYLWTLWQLRRMVCSATEKRFAEAIHWRWPRYWPLYAAGGIVMSGAMQWLGNALPHPQELPIDRYFASTTASWAMAFFGTLVAPLAEELLFRGMLYPVLRRKWGVAAAILLTTAGFALIHFDQLGGAWGPILVIVLVGLILTVVRQLTDSVGSSFAVHLFYNGTIFALAALSSHGFMDVGR
jgi:hypothetical protein